MQLVAVQLDIAWEDRAANHRKVQSLLKDVPVATDAIIVLPEMFDVAFSMNPAATNPGDPSLSESFCRQLAAEKHAAVLAGVVARAENGQLANEAVAFSPKGSQLVRYRKMQPFSGAGEERCYPAGMQHRLFRLNDLVIAPFICYDLRFPELFRRAARDGAELFVVIANWPDKRSEHWVRLLQARAIENQAYVLGVNRTGADPTLNYDGRSSLFDPMGRELVQADRREQVLSAEIDATLVRQWRSDFGALRDMKHL
jgi:predicted amidohydrolase